MFDVCETLAVDTLHSSFVVIWEKLKKQFDSRLCEVASLSERTGFQQFVEKI
jgi:hypothetical protein